MGISVFVCTGKRTVHMYLFRRRRWQRHLCVYLKKMLVRQIVSWIEFKYENMVNSCLSPPICVDACRTNSQTKSQYCVLDRKIYVIPGCFHFDSPSLSTCLTVTDWISTSCFVNSTFQKFRDLRCG